MNEKQQNSHLKPKKQVSFSKTQQVIIHSSSPCLEVIKMDIPIKRVQWRKRIKVYKIPSRTELKRYSRSLWYCNEEIQQMEKETFELYLQYLKKHPVIPPQKLM